MAAAAAAAAAAVAAAAATKKKEETTRQKNTRKQKLGQVRLPVAARGPQRAPSCLDEHARAASRGAGAPNCVRVPRGAAQATFTVKSNRECPDIWQGGK